MIKIKKIENNSSSFEARHLHDKRSSLSINDFSHYYICTGKHLGQVQNYRKGKIEL